MVRPLRAPILLNAASLPMVQKRAKMAISLNVLVRDLGALSCDQHNGRFSLEIRHPALASLVAIRDDH